MLRNPNNLQILIHSRRVGQPHCQLISGYQERPKRQTPELICYEIRTKASHSYVTGLTYPHGFFEHLSSDVRQVSFGTPAMAFAIRRVGRWFAARCRFLLGSYLLQRLALHATAETAGFQEKP